MVIDVSCIVCGGADHTNLYKSNFEGSVEEASDYFLSHRKKVAHGQIVSCNECGFVFTSPQFSPSDYDLIYQNAPPKPDDSFDFQEAENRRFSRLSRIVRKYVSPGHYLDLGCGRGGFLDIMNDGQGIGFDVGRVGVRQSRLGFRIITGSFSDIKENDEFEQEAFSFVTAFDVFEHLSNLPQYLVELHRIIRFGGHLVITVPNVESIVARISGERWNMILLEHLWYFSPKTLKQLLERYGFEVVMISPMPYEAPISHLVNRITQTYHLNNLPVPKWIGSITLPVPIGLMAAVLRRI